MRYLYGCSNCKESWEEDYPVKERDVPLDKECPSCSTHGYVKRYISCVPFHLKGSGWAKDGYSTHYGDVDKVTARIAKEQVNKNKRQRKR